MQQQNRTQKELAEIVGVSSQQISKIVKGSENLTLETIAKLEAAPGIPLLLIPNNNSSNNVEIEKPPFALVAQAKKSIMLNSEALQKSFYCHSERSEESIKFFFKRKLPNYISAGAIIIMHLCRRSLNSEAHGIKKIKASEKAPETLI